MAFTLHPQLAADTHLIGQLETNTLLLHKNALIPWFILVPPTDASEIHHLTNEQQQNLNSCINQLAGFVEQHFSTDKLNIATIGNIVPQLHVHIIGRYINDFCWPKPVWGQTKCSDYTEAALLNIKQQALAKLPSLIIN